MQHDGNGLLLRNRSPGFFTAEQEKNGVLHRAFRQNTKEQLVFQIVPLTPINPPLTPPVHVSNFAQMQKSLSVTTCP
jgi:hypothetical protein